MSRLPWFKMAKHKYLSNVECFSLWSNTLFGLLDCDYTQKNGKLWIYVDFHEDGHIQAHVQAKNNLIDQLFKNHFKMLNQGKVDPPIISKVIITNMLGNVIEFIDVYVKIKQWDVIKMCNLYWLQFFTFFQITYQ